MSETKQILLACVVLTAAFGALVGVAIWRKARREGREAERPTRARQLPTG